MGQILIAIVIREVMCLEIFIAFRILLIDLISPLICKLQPGPRDAPLKCFIRRNRATQSYFLCIGVTDGMVIPPMYPLGHVQCGCAHCWWNKCFSLCRISWWWEIPTFCPQIPKAIMHWIPDFTWCAWYVKGEWYLYWQVKVRLEEIDVGVWKLWFALLFFSAVHDNRGSDITDISE